MPRVNKQTKTQLVKLPLDMISQHDRLAIRISSEKNDQLPEGIVTYFLEPHRVSFYFFMLMICGSSTHKVDFQEITFMDNELLVIFPDQVHKPPAQKNHGKYYKLGFNEHCLSLLPRSFPFLINPLNIQVIRLGGGSAQRVQSLLENMNQLLNSNEECSTKNTSLILTHLDTLLTEFDRAYFESTPSEEAYVNADLSVFIRFKMFIEEHLVKHYSISEIAYQLSVSPNSLYHLVRRFSGMPPKEYITSRIILEAKRRLCYTHSSAKELAYGLGYNDPDYFSRLFKKYTGQSIIEYLKSVH